MKLYFDNNIYRLIAENGAAAAIKKALKSQGHRVYASLEGNITEALRTPDAAERTRRLQAILLLAAGVHPPLDYLHYREIADELMRLRPAWFSHPLDARVRMQYLRRRQGEWNVLRENPGHLPPRVAASLAKQHDRIYEAVKTDTGRQRLSKKTRPKGWPLKHRDAEIQACIDSRPRADQHWRYVNSQEGVATITAELQIGGHLEWLRGLKWPQPAVEWDCFWLCDVDAVRVPISRIIGLIEFMQRDHKVTSGNTLDRVSHAPHLVVCDRLLTADGDFHKIQTEVRSEMGNPPEMGVPVLVDVRGLSVVDAITRALAEHSPGD